MRDIESFADSIAPGQIWVGSDYILMPLRYEDDPTGGDSVLVVEVFRGQEHFEAWASIEDLFCDYPGARRLV